MKKIWIACMIALSLMLALTVSAVAAQEVDYQNAYICWDGKTTDKDFTPEAFEALTQTTVYRSEESPTGYYVTFRFYGPDLPEVEIAGEWYYSEPIYSSQTTAAKIHPRDWYNGCYIHTDDVNPIRPFDQMELNKETGYWMFTIPLASGTYCYQFRVDGKLQSDPQNPPAEREPGIEAYSQVLVPYDEQKQSLSPDYSKYQSANDQHGTILYDAVPSPDLLGYDLPFGIYLPAGYDEHKEGGYKYVILGHGIAGFESNWVAQGMLGNITDNLIAEGLVEPMIIVSPNMRDGEGKYIFSGVNADGSWITEIDGEPVANEGANPSWAKQVSQAQPFFINEMIPYLEANYNVTKEVSGRAFAGLSAGAMCTYNMFLGCPEDFGYFYMMSGANATPEAYDLTREELKEPTVAFGCGIFDRLFFSNVHPTQIAFAEAGIEFTNYYALGAHRWHVWRELYVDMMTRVLWK
ncbi:MAG: alpha/beta hydrolase-fold protein [Clostridia bacterium]|nr:alpha/beta hydrolase-fold protein [Clostridia bacterium]